VAQIVKSLVVVLDDARPALALVSGANRLDLAGLAAAAGATTARMADAEEARAATGFAVGGVPPFGHPAPLPTWVDPDLVGFEVVHAAAGTPDTCVPITPAALLEATSGTVAPIAQAS
jgi:prolyl-tRNA editing enzyme YbaK/EbsC (Cys-tRNA(Pro) deacylase)